MKWISTYCFTVLTLIFGFSQINCGSDSGGGIDPNDPGTFVGTYDIVEITVNANNEVFTAGEPFNFSNVTITLTGTLILTSTQYTLSFTTVTADSSGEEEVDVAMTAGTYSIGPNQITIDPDDDAPFTLELSVSGNRITIRNIPNEDFGPITIIFQKR